ncbi:MAG: protease complex subunit PrcB family protein [Planctomycetota bacterium]|nr:protease complex subunit PrcB family protein [Planctomycetota bacterium]
MKTTLCFALFTTLSSTLFAQGGTSPFCSTGLNASRISATGSSLLAANGGAGDLVLHASNIPAGAPGVFIMSQAVSQGFPFGQGTLCLNGSIVRLPVVTNATFAIDYTAPALAGLFTPASSWNFQFWFRSGSSFDVSDGIEVTFDTQELVTNIVNIEQSFWSGHPLAWTGGIELIQDQATWDAFWVQHAANQFPLPPTPFVDFNQSAVVAVFTGTISHGGVSITVRSCGLSVTTLEVRTITQGPGMGCAVTAAITQPCHIVSVPRVPNMTLGNWVGSGLFIDCP